MTKKTDLVTKVFEDVRSSIRDFHLLPGVKVSDKEIADRMQISRTPVREALVRLAEKGLLQALPNRGFRVRKFSGQDISNLYTLREALEVLAVRLATRNLNKMRINKLRKAIEQAHAASLDGRLKDACLAEETFHDLIAEYSGNDLLYKTLHDLGDQIHIARRYDHMRIGSAERIFEEHSRILDLMAQGDEDSASFEMAEHIIESKENFEKQWA